MKTILVPTDFSKNADNALSFAILLAQKIKAKLVLFNAFQVQIPVAEVPFSLLEEMKEGKSNEANNKLRSECEKIKHAGGLEFEYCAYEGASIDAILNYTQHHYFDYIIMGTKGAGKNRTHFFGSTTTRLIAKTDIPVIAIPEKARF